MTARNISLGFLFPLLLAFLSLAQQKEVKQVEIKKVPITHTDPTSGQEMYTAYCAVCHGTDGKGVGPATPALKTAPPDLTTLTKRNNGKYPALHVAQIIKGDIASPAHGDKDMPVWGRAFRSLQSGTTFEADVQRRISSLNGYIESLQEK
jgi:mono/diheme cytochrome c family protein